MPARIHVAQPLHHLARERALQGDQRVARAGVHRGDVEAPRLLDDPGEVLLDIRGVDDEEEVVLGEPVHQHVVHEGPGRRRQARVVGLPDLQARGIVGADPLDGGEGVLARQFDLAHVGDVEQAGPRAHREVLLRQAGILHRHVPAGKRHHAGAECPVTGVQGCLFQWSVGCVAHGMCERGKDQPTLLWPPTAGQAMRAGPRGAPASLRPPAPESAEAGDQDDGREQDSPHERRPPPGRREPAAARLP